MAGFFWTYSDNVNLAMLQVDGATYATVQSLFNMNVRHAAVGHAVGARRYFACQRPFTTVQRLACASICFTMAA